MYFLDSDAAKKICQYHLLHELAGALKCTLSDFVVLPQLRFQLKLVDDQKALSKLETAEAVELARLLVSAASEAVITINAANPILQLGRPDIDTGEAVLFAALSADEQSKLVSGDKRAFIALSKVDSLPVVDALWPRLICFEEAIYLILHHSDFDMVSAKIRARPDVDAAMGISFGRSIASPKISVIDALKSYMNDLSRNTKGKYQAPLAVIQ